MLYDEGVLLFYRDLVLEAELRIQRIRQMVNRSQV